MIVARHMDRLLRRLAEFESVLERCQKTKTAIVTAADGVDTSTDGGRLVARISRRLLRVRLSARALASAQPRFRPRSMVDGPAAAGLSVTKRRRHCPGGRSRADKAGLCRRARGRVDELRSHDAGTRLDS